jgi:hypothetical protein
MFPPVLQTLKANPAVTAILGDPPRVFARDDAPQDGDRPYVSWFIVTGTPENELSDVPGIDRQTIQVDVWSKQDEQSRALASAVRDAIEPVAHMTSMPVDGRERDTKLYRIGMQFDWWLPR